MVWLVRSGKVLQHWEEDSSRNRSHLLSTCYVRDTVTHAFHTLSLLPPTDGASIIIPLSVCFILLFLWVNKRVEKIEQPEGHPISKSGSRHPNAYLLDKKKKKQI